MMLLKIKDIYHPGDDEAKCLAELCGLEHFDQEQYKNICDEWKSDVEIYQTGLDGDREICFKYT